MNRSDTRGDLQPGERSRSEANGSSHHARPSAVEPLLEELGRVAVLQGRDLRALIAESRRTNALLERIAVALEKGPPRAASTGPAGATPPNADGVASDGELDGPYGNPQVRQDPPRWAGDSYKTQTMSLCPPDYLDELSGFLAWRSRQPPRAAPEGRAADDPVKHAKYAGYAAKDARLARGWAARLRAGWVAPPSAAPTDDEDEPLPQ